MLVLVCFFFYIFFLILLFVLSFFIFLAKDLKYYNRIHSRSERDSCRNLKDSYSARILYFPGWRVLEYADCIPLQRSRRFILDRVKDWESEV